jgi:hypothetical protein
MSYTTQQDEFTIQDAKIKEDKDGRIGLLVLETEEVPSGAITCRPEVEEEVVGDDGIKRTKDKPATIQDLPEELVEALKQAVEIEEIKICAKVTERDPRDDPEMDGEKRSYFINNENLDSFETRLFVDEGGEE